MLRLLQKRVIAELKRAYPEYVDSENLIFVMQDIFAYTNCPFVILIDEWDCLFREYRQDEDAQKKYLDFLRAWLKDKDCVALAYMTGILPIKKYGSHSALNTSKDDVLTLLVHLGYLTYDSTKETVAIPNKEVSQEYVNAISTMDWQEVIHSVEVSRN